MNNVYFIKFFGSNVFSEVSNSDLILSYLVTEFQGVVTETNIGPSPKHSMDHCCYRKFRPELLGICKFRVRKNKLLGTF